jgi:hypothetical protein
MVRTMLVCGAAILALAACSKKADQSAANSGTPAAGEAAKTASAEAPGPVGPPTRKAGLWEQTISSDKMHQTIRMCIDEATEQKAKWWRSEGRRSSSGDTDCSEQKVTRTLTGGWNIHAVCKSEGMTVTTDGTATGDFGNNYHVELTSTSTGSSIPEANGTRKMVMDGVWKGPCPAGWTGGDMEVNGMRMNVLNPQAAPTGPGMPAMKAGHMPTQAEIAQMRAQAMEMEKRMKAGAQ